jgi:hypothetical protein
MHPLERALLLPSSKPGKPAAPKPAPIAPVQPIVHPLPPSALDELRRWRLQASQRYVARSLARSQKRGGK